MSLYAALIAGLLWAASIAGSYFYGVEVGDDGATARQAREADVRRETRELAQQGAAAAISEIEVKHVTIRQRVEREIREHPVYRDCRHTPGGLRGVNAALTGDDSEPPGGGQLSAASAPGR